MSAAAITFDEMDRKSQETRGWALAARNTRNRIISSVLFGVAAHTLKNLINGLSPEMLDQLSPEHASQLKKDLQELHALLASLCTAPQAGGFERIPFGSRLMETIGEYTEDLSDRIESLALAENEEFRLLVSKCVESVGTADRGRV